MKEYESSFEIWIAADGTPLASSARLKKGTGRAFIVVSFQMSQDEDCTYAVAGHRLLTLRREMHNVSGGMGEHGDLRVVKTLQLQS